MSDERALRGELESLQHQGKVLRAEQALPNGPKFLETRDALTRQLMDETPALAREVKLAEGAEAEEAELNASIELGRTALAAAEQRKLSPGLVLVPMLSFCLLTAWAVQGDTLLADKTFARALATLSAAIAGFIIGTRVWSPSIHQAPFRERAKAWTVAHVLRNFALWAVVPLGAAVVLLITSGSVLSPVRVVTFVEAGWCQVAALTAFALALRALPSTEASHRSVGRIEAAVAGGVLLASALLSARVLGNEWFSGGGLLLKATLGVAVTVPLFAGVAWFWLKRGAWLVPSLLSVVASGVVLTNGRPAAEDALEIPVPVRNSTRAELPRVPAFLLQDEAEGTVAARLAADARSSANAPANGIPWRSRGGPEPRHEPRAIPAAREIDQVLARRVEAERVISVRRSVDVAAFLLAVQFALIAVLSAWFFTAASTGRRRWVVLPLLPVALLVFATLARG